MKYKGIIIRCTPYKESDAMINLLTNEGLLPFKARSVFKFEGKNSILSNPLLYGNFTFLESNYKYKNFKEVEIILDTGNYINDLKTLSFLNYINELILRIFDDEDIKLIYSTLEFILLNLENINLNLALLIFICKCLTLTGFGINTSNYKNKEYISFDFINGRFITIENFNDKQNKIYSSIQKEILNFGFNSSIQDLLKFEYKNNDINYVIKDLNQYLLDSCGIKLKSAKLIEKVL